MDVPRNNSVLSTNNSFHKIYKTISEKKSKNDLATKELEWIQSQLLSDDAKIVENAVNVLVSSCDVGFALNSFVVALPRLPNGSSYELVADGIIQLLLPDLKNPEYKCQFGIHQKAHPMLLLIDESSDKMLYLSMKIAGILNNDNRYIRANAVEFLRPVLLTILCNEKICCESREIWRNLLENEEIVQEVHSKRRTSTSSSRLLFNSMILMQLTQSKTPTESFLLLMVATKRLVESSMDPSENFKVILSFCDSIEPSASNIILFLLAEILQTTSIVHIPKLLEIIEKLVVKKQLGHTVILRMLLDGLIQVLAYPSFAKGRLSAVERIIKHIEGSNQMSEVKTSLNAHLTCPDLTNARDVSIMLESQRDIRVEKIKTEAERFFWTRNQLVLRGFLHSSTTNTEIILENLIEISKPDEGLKNSLIMPLLYKLSYSHDPRVKLSVLHNLIKLGATTEIFSTVKALSSGLLRSMSIDLHLRLWRIEPRTYPFLHKMLVEKSAKDAEDEGLEIVRAAAIREICDVRPQHGSDLVSMISEILNNSDAGDVAGALAIDSITLLCQNHVINVVSTWKAISLTTRYEKRPRVVKSLSKFFAIIPSLKRNSLDYENLAKEILARLWHMIQWSDEHGVKCALEAMNSWNYDSMTLDAIPEDFRDGFALPVASPDTEVSILDLEVPGECFVQLLIKVPAASCLLTHYISCEIADFRSGHYLVKEGQPEPMSYKSLPKQSILKALIQFLIQQATTKKMENLVKIEIVGEALKILAAKYSRPLPPLNWCFLTDLMTKSGDVRAECLKTAAKQSVISGTAKRTIENFITSFDKEFEGDLEIAMNSLVDLCNGVSGEVLRTFCEYVFKDQREFVDEKLVELLKREKEVTNRENLAAVVSIYILTCSPSINFIKLVPPKILDAIHFQLSYEQRINYRCEILKSNSSVENPISWVNELLLLTDDTSNVFFTSFVSLLITSDNFPKKKFINDFIIMTQNRMVESDFPAEKLKFFLEIFIVTVNITSGYYKILNSSEKFFRSHEKILLEIFPQSLELVSRQSSFNDVIGRIFEFLLHVIEYDGVKIGEETRQTFQRAILMSKDHEYFKKGKVWQKCLMMKLN